MNKQKIRLEVVLDDDLSEALDRERGLVPRASFVRDLIEKRMRKASFYKGKR